MNLRLLVGIMLVTHGTMVIGAPPRAEKVESAKDGGTLAAAAEDDYLSDLARQLLRRRMGRHGRDIGALSRSVVINDRELVAQLATAIATEPRITRPGIGSGDELNSELPERFFVLQDELRSRAKALTEATREPSGDAMLGRFGDLIRTCASCHSAFLERRTRR